MQREASSYRDPDGYIAYVNGDIYRCVTNKDAAILKDQYQKFFQAAIQRGLLVPFEPADKKASEGTMLKLEPLPLVSYPYEWGFEQLKEAALLTLDICLLALDHGLTLKDATAFNAQQYNGRMIFIDHTSFEPSNGALPWRPYSQFCKHFIAPLLLTSYRGHNAIKRFRTDLDGLDLGEVCNALPFLARFRPSVFVHLYLHSSLIKGHKHKNTADDKEHVSSAGQNAPGKSGAQKAYLEHLKRVIEHIKPPKYDTEWHDYYNNTNYNAGAFKEKEDIIEQTVSGKNYAHAWDVGGNNGHFSRILARHVDAVVSMDIDYAAVDLNYRKNRQEKVTNIHPLVFDLSNPSPSIGFANAERPRLEKRSEPDIVVALAVIHHLAVTYNIPFPLLAKYFRDLGADLLIEYVDREDSQFQKILKNKGDPYPHYTQENFEASFYEVFDLVKKTKVADAHRCLYLLTPKR